MTVDQLLGAAGLLAPGFIAMKLFYVFGAQRQRLQWEWAAWSVLISLPIDAVTQFVKPGLRSMNVSENLADVAVRLALALLGALLAALIWQLVVKPSDNRYVVKLRRFVTDSAWDEVMDDAVAHQRYLEVVTEGPSDELTFRGWLSTAGREDAAAEPWLYLRQVLHKQDQDGDWVELEGTHGLLIHRDHIKRVRVFETILSDEKPPKGRATIAAASGRPKLARRRQRKADLRK